VPVDIPPAPVAFDDEARFKEAFRRVAATVTLVTYRDEEGRSCGMTATSMCSVSLLPPTMLVCINRSSKTHAALTEDGRFGVNLLSAKQVDVADHCSSPGAEKILREEWLLAASQPPTARSPVLAEALAHFDCDVGRAYKESTHTIFIGEVRRVRLGPLNEPLVYVNRRYRDYESDVRRSSESLWERIAFANLT
jgi:flavin reductase (DIM6/NTAB) family NADH-FMN oxidoreductase RutF